MYDSWTCLMVEKGPGILPDDVRTALKVAACDLHLRRQDKMFIRSDIIDGVIQTKWDTHMVGARSGVLFRAQIDCNDGTDYKVNFLFGEYDLERGAEMLKQMGETEDGSWEDLSTPFPVKELYQFYDLNAGTSRTVN